MVGAKYLLLIGLSLAISGCPPNVAPASPKTVHSDNPVAEASFKQARDTFMEGRREIAKQEFNDFLRLFPGDPLAWSAMVFLGRIALGDGNPDLATSLLNPVLERASDDSVARQARLYAGVALHRSGSSDGAVRRLAELMGKMTDHGDNLLLLDTLWRAARALNDDRHTVAWLDGFLEFGPAKDAREDAMRELQRTCDGISDVVLLKELGSDLDARGAAWPLVMSRLAWIRHDEGDLDAVADILKVVEKAGRAQDDAVTDIIELLEDRTTVDMGAVGCLLPLSGRSRLVGQTVLKGVMIGVDAVRFGDDRRSLSVVIRDSGKGASQAVAALEDLVLKENVAAVIGPMDTAVSRAVAGRAQQLGVPIVLLSVKEGMAGTGSNVFRGFPSNASEVKALLDTASRMGGTAYAIMYPEDGYGRAMRRAFIEKLADIGVKPAAEVGYSPDDTDFIEEASELFKTEFDVLFIPDRASRIALIAPALASEGIWSTVSFEPAPGSGRAVQLLLPSIGYSTDLVRRAGRYLQGALAARHYLADAGLSASRFDDRFADEYGARPTYFSALGHDAAVLVAGAVADGVKGRVGIRRWIRGLGEDSDLPFAAPFKGFDSRGETAASPWILMLNGDGWELLR